MTSQHENDTKYSDTMDATAEAIEFRLAADRADLASKPRWYRFWVNSWTQICIVSLVCFALPGMYNAIQGKSQLVNYRARLTQS
jgi:hypothetical protein